MADGRVKREQRRAAPYPRLAVRYRQLNRGAHAKRLGDNHSRALSADIADWANPWSRQASHLHTRRVLSAVRHKPATAVRSSERRQHAGASGDSSSASSDEMTDRLVTLCQRNVNAWASSKLDASW